MNIHDPFHRLSDDELLAAEFAALNKASDAPKSLDGAYSDAHARFGAEWAHLFREVLRRGLPPASESASPKKQENVDG